MSANDILVFKGEIRYQPDMLHKRMSTYIEELELETIRLRCEIEAVQKISTGALEGVMAENAELRAAIKTLHSRFEGRQKR